MADKNYPTASLSISFQTEVVGGDGSSSHLSVEVNSEDNNGKTQFLFGDTAKYRIYKSPDIRSLIIIISDGSEGPDSSGLTAEMVETLAWTGSPTANTSKLIQSLISAERMGGLNLGSISKVGPTTLQCSKQSTGPLDPLVGVYKVKYRTQYDLRKLWNVAEPAGFGLNGFDSYPVVVYLIGIVG